jgi:DNA-binding transcriptional MerR regulator
MKVLEDRNYRVKDVAEILCVSRSTLRAWDRDGHFVAGRTVGKHRIYTGKQVIEMQQRMFKIREEVKK